MLPQKLNILKLKCCEKLKSTEITLTHFSVPETVTLIQGFNVRLANRAFLVFDFWAL